MYYICDVRKPNEPFLFSNEIGGKFHHAMYADKAEADKICAKMNATTSLTKFEVKEI